MAQQKGKDKKNADDDKSPFVVSRYHKRLSILKLANDYSQRDNVVKAVEGYLEYLKILADYYEVEEAKLRPTAFNLEKDVPELLLISQVYWGLAKAYDRNPKLHDESKRCLEQFVRFSTGFKYQYINAQMLRKFIRRRMAYQPKIFEEAYQQLQVDSKKCYIASYCYGTCHPVTEHLRRFKGKIVDTALGWHFVDMYYRTSPVLVEFCLKNPRLGSLFKHSIFRPALKIFVTFLKIIRIR